MTDFKIRADGVAWQEVDDDLIVLDEHKAVYMRLAGAATELWPLLVAGTTLDAMTDALQQTFGVAPEHAERDVRAFVNSLETNALLEASP